MQKKKKTLFVSSRVAFKVNGHVLKFILMDKSWEEAQFWPGLIEQMACFDAVNTCQTCMLK